MVATELKKDYGIRIKYCHSGLTASERDVVRREWQEGEIQVIALTTGDYSGMGRDQADVRFVVHFSIPSSLEAYREETKCSSRDGSIVTCRLYLITKIFVRTNFSLNRMTVITGNRRHCTRIIGIL